MADVDGDGRLDAVVQTACSQACTNQAVSVLLGNGDGTFRSAVSYTLAGMTGFAGSGQPPMGSVAVADVNGDGKLDIVAASQCGGANSTAPCGNSPVNVLLGNGDGTFQPAVTYSTGNNFAVSAAVVDVNHDGKPDIETANLNGTVSVLINTAFFDFTPPTTTATPSPGPNGKGWNKTSVTVHLSATDNTGGSGVKEIQYSLTGAQNQGWQTIAGNSAAVVISTPGTTTLNYFATDNAGNQESPKAVIVRIEETPPVISGMPGSECLVAPPGHHLVEVATVTATDALSGLVKDSFTVTGTSNHPDRGEIQITGGPGDFQIKLGAEHGLVYTLTATAKDEAGNVETEQATCTVPHKHRKN